MIRSSSILLKLLVLLHTCGSFTAAAKNLRTLKFPPSSLQSESATRDNNSRELIVGGTQAATGEFPWFVSSVGNGYCGASLISPTVVMTAAHCGDVFGEGRSVVIGAVRRNSLLGGAQARTIVQQVIHPLYHNVTWAYDVMLLQLNEPVTDVEPLQYNTDPVYYHETSYFNVTVMGFGRVEYKVGDVSRNLLKTDLVTISDDHCLDYYSPFDLRTDSMMCAWYTDPDEPKASCQGDSGGPLVTMVQNSDGTTKSLQLGVVSWGVECGHDEYPGVYAKTAGFADWLDETICSLEADCQGPTVAPSPSPPPEYSLRVTFTYGGSDPTQRSATTWDIVQLLPDGQETILHTGPSNRPKQTETWSEKYDGLMEGDFRFDIHDNLPGGSFSLKLMSEGDPLGTIVGYGSHEGSAAQQLEFEVERLTKQPSTAPTQAPNSSPTEPTEHPTYSRPCVCLAGSSSCRDSICEQNSDDEDQCLLVGCTWTIGLDPDATPPPNVEDPTDDDDGDIDLEGDEEDEMSDLEKFGIASIVGVGAGMGTLLTLGLLHYIFCRERRPRQPRSSSQPKYPSRRRSDLPGSGSTDTEDSAEISSSDHPPPAYVFEA